MVPLGLGELREVAAFAVACARPALAVFEEARPGDGRPRAALEAAQAFAAVRTSRSRRRRRRAASGDHDPPRAP